MAVEVRSRCGHQGEGGHAVDGGQQPVLAGRVYPAEEEALGEIDGAVRSVAIRTLPRVWR
jgi:hypothetical protein